MATDFVTALFSLLLFLYLLAVSVLPLGNSANADVSNRGVVHTVFLWLQQPGDAQHRRQLVSASDRLRSIPGVLDIRFGEVIESERDIVDDSSVY